MFNAIDLGLNDITDYVATLADSYLRDPEKGAFDTGFLARSRIVNKDEKFKKWIAYEASYASFIEFGTSPHFPPVMPLYKWVWLNRAKLGITPGKLKKTKKDGDVYENIWNMAWAICGKIAKEGSEPKPYLRPAVNEGKLKVKDFIKKKVEEIK